MTKISYEIFGNTGEIALVKREGGDICFSFIGIENGYFCIADKKRSLSEGSVVFSSSEIGNGTHLPRLITEKGQILLPLLEKQDELISFPVKDMAQHSLSLKIARLNKRLTELEKRVLEIDSYVHGSTCF